MAVSVDIENLDLRFGTIEVLKNLNLSIDEGEFPMLPRSPGCGKSTPIDRKHPALSGDRRQRVAIGRVPVRDVDVFLLDEPLFLGNRASLFDVATKTGFSPTR